MPLSAKANRQVSRTWVGGAGEEVAAILDSINAAIDLEGDGVTDETTALSNLLNGAADGSTIYFGSQLNILITDEITVSNVSNLRLLFQPGSKITFRDPGTSALTVGLGTPASNLPSGVLTFNNCDGLLIDGMNWVGNHTRTLRGSPSTLDKAPFAIVLKDSENSTIRNSYCSGMLCGFAYHSTSSSGAQGEVTFDNNEMTGIYSDFLNVAGEYTSTLWSIALFSECGHRVKFTRNKIKNFGYGIGNGANTIYFGPLEASGNRFADMVHGGILFSSFGMTHITNNIVDRVMYIGDTNSGGFGIKVGGHGFIVQGNIIRDAVLGIACFGLQQGGTCTPPVGGGSSATLDATGILVEPWWDATIRADGTGYELVRLNNYSQIVIDTVLSETSRTLTTDAPGHRVTGNSVYNAGIAGIYFRRQLGITPAGRMQGVACTGNYLEHCGSLGFGSISCDADTSDKHGDRTLIAANTLQWNHTHYVSRVSVSGTTVTWIEGSYFNHDGNGTAVWTGTVYINGTAYTISSIESAKSMTLTASAGTISAALLTKDTTTGQHKLISVLGYATDPPKGIVIANNVLRGSKRNPPVNNGHGISLISVTESIVCGNMIEDVLNIGVALSGVSKSIIANNVAMGGSVHGIYVSTSATYDPDPFDNIIVGNYGDFITFELATDKDKNMLANNFPASANYLSGSGAPSATPRFIGQWYLDTTGKKWYLSTGTSSSADFSILN